MEHGKTNLRREIKSACSGRTINRNKLLNSSSDHNGKHEAIRLMEEMLLVPTYLTLNRAAFIITVRRGT